jgi:hypothetical protein
MKVTKMNLNSNRLSQFILLAPFAVFMASGCVRFAGMELPIYTNEQLSAPEKRISASYDVMQFHGTYPQDATAASQRIERVLSASPLFVELKTGSGQADYHYSFVLRSAVMPSEFIASLNGFISGFTFLVIPAYERDIFIMTVVVKKGDYVLKTYNYKDHTDSWIQVFLLLLMPFNFPPMVYDSVMDNIIMNFAHDFSSDLQSGFYRAQQQ